MDILTSIQPVIKNSRHVAISHEGIEKFVREFDRRNCMHWLQISPIDIMQLDEETRIGFLFALNSISFSYWGNPKWEIEFHGKTHSFGTQAMMASLARALEEDIPVCDPSYLAALQREELRYILRGNVEIPLLDERVRILQEVGTVTQREFNGDYRRIVAAAQLDAVQFVSLLISMFPSFHDSSRYKGHAVYFHKRAQLLASDIHYCMCPLDNFDAMTACADYKLPLVLRRYGILKYTPPLESRIRQEEHLEAESEEEIEIRAHTIHAVELMKEKINGVSSSQLNDYLWLHGQTRFPHDEPYHKTRTIAY